MSSKVLVLGANGMLGASLFRYLSKKPGLEVLGTVRQPQSAKKLQEKGYGSLKVGVDVNDFAEVENAIKVFRPDYLLNCVGIIKQLDQSKAPIPSLEINSLLPHRLAEVCEHVNAKLIHFSTDCVFSGRSGQYLESDTPDASDLYGRSKLLGEVGYGRHLTLRTSIIGHELNTSVSLVDWFLSQTGTVKGFNQAVFSGLPTVYVAEFLYDYIFGESISGLYHLSVDPIDKYTLLQLVKTQYGADMELRPSGDLVIDRSLNSDRLRKDSGFAPLRWEELIKKMREEYLEYFV